MMQSDNAINTMGNSSIKEVLLNPTTEENRDL